VGTARTNENHSSKTRNRKMWDRIIETIVISFKIDADDISDLPVYSEREINFTESGEAA
jgi:hypothetical protein